MVTQGTILSQRYLLEEELGTGGMGTVYRAVDLRTGARVAVKIPHAFLIRDRQYVERLRREAHIAASLHSSRVALVTDFAEHERTPYLVMEYVPGQSLADLIAEKGALPPEEALRIALEVARALDAANAAGIVHRDLKPHNIRITRDGDVKVLDFGIARVQGQSALTSNSMFLGSPDYSAPERAEGEGDIRADIYSVGITLHEMLSGRLPFGSGTPYTILRRQVSEPPAPLPDGLPQMVYPIVARCLEKRPEDRYQTPRELVQDLTAAQRQIDRDNDAASRMLTHTSTPAPALDATKAMPAPVPAAPPPPPSRADGAVAASPPPTAPVPRRSRLPLVAGIGALVLALLIGGIVLATRGGSSAPDGSSPSAVLGSATPALGGTVAIAFTQPAEGARLKPGPVTVKVKADGLNLKPPTANDPDGRHLHYFLDVDPALVVAPGQPVPTGQSNIIHSAETEQTFSNLPTGQHTVAVVATGNDHRPLPGSETRKVTFTVLPDISAARGGAAAPIAYQYQGPQDSKFSIYLMNGDGKNQRQLTPAAIDAITPAWSPDGKFIAFSSKDGGDALKISVINVETREIRRLTSGPGNDRSPSWSPDAKSLVFESDRSGQGQNLLYIVPAEGGEARPLTSGQRNDSHPAWSPDGSLIAFHSLQGNLTRLFVIAATGGTPREVNTGQGNDIDPAWSPDGAQLAFASTREGGWGIYIVPAEGGEARRVTEKSTAVTNIKPSWSPDAKQIVFESDRDGQQHIYAIPAEGGALTRLTQGSGRENAPVYPLR